MMENEGFEPCTPWLSRCHGFEFLPALLHPQARRRQGSCYRGSFGDVLRLYGRKRANVSEKSSHKSSQSAFLTFQVRHDSGAQQETFAGAKCGPRNLSFEIVPRGDMDREIGEINERKGQNHKT